MHLQPMSKSERHANGNNGNIDLLVKHASGKTTITYNSIIIDQFSRKRRIQNIMRGF